jgi:hypothetical protein
VTLVRVFWNDAQSSATKIYLKSRDHAPTIMETIGWLMDDDESGVSVCNERYTEDGEVCFRGHTFVPRGIVVSVVQVTPT